MDARKRRADSVRRVLRKKQRADRRDEAAARAEKKRPKRNVAAAQDEKTALRMERLLKLAKRDARREFEKEKSRIMALIPRAIKSKFGEIGFGKFKKSYDPALILDPYSVPPGDARDAWMDMVQKRQDNCQPLDKMAFLVYWYGETSPKRFYGLVPFNSFVPYNEAPKQMLDFASGPSKRREKGKKLSFDDMKRLRGAVQLAEDLPKAPNERRRGDIDFQEGHEMLCFDDFSDDDMEELADEEEEELSDSTIDDANPAHSHSEPAHIEDPVAGPFLVGEGDALFLNSGFTGQDHLSGSDQPPESATASQEPPSQAILAAFGSLDNKLNEFSQSLASREQKLVALAEENARLAKVNAEQMEARCAELSEKLAAKEEELAAVMKEKEELQLANANLHTRLAQGTEKVNGRDTGRATSLEEELADLAQRCAMVGGSAEDVKLAHKKELEQLVASQNYRIKELTQSHQQEMASMVQQRDSAKAEMEKVDDKNRELKSRQVDDKRQIERLEQQIAQLQPKTNGASSVDQDQRAETAAVTPSRPAPAGKQEQDDSAE